MSGHDTESRIDLPFLFRVGDEVRKSSGYEFPGVVRAAFFTKALVVRYVVEHSQSEGMLHIFSGTQLELVKRA